MTLSSFLKRATLFPGVPRVVVDEVHLFSLELTAGEASVQLGAAPGLWSCASMRALSSSCRWVRLSAVSFTSTV